MTSLSTLNTLTVVDTRSRKIDRLGSFVGGLEYGASHCSKLLYSKRVADWQVVTFCGRSLDSAIFSQCCSSVPSTLQFFADRVAR